MKNKEKNSSLEGNVERTMNDPIKGSLKGPIEGNLEILAKVLFYSRELLKIKLSYKKKGKISDSFQTQKIQKIYKDLKKEIARLSALL